MRLALRACLRSHCIRTPLARITRMLLKVPALLLVLATATCRLCWGDDGLTGSNKSKLPQAPQQSTKSDPKTQQIGNVQSDAISRITTDIQNFGGTKGGLAAAKLAYASAKLLFGDESPEGILGDDRARILVRSATRLPRCRAPTRAGRRNQSQTLSTRQADRGTPLFGGRVGGLGSSPEVAGQLRASRATVSRITGTAAAVAWRKQYRNREQHGQFGRRVPVDEGLREGGTAVSKGA